MSRHHFLQPENFKPSQFRIRAPKKDYKNIHPKHLSISIKMNIVISKKMISTKKIMDMSKNIGMKKKTISTKKF